MAAVAHCLILFPARGYGHATAVGHAVDEMFFPQAYYGEVSFPVSAGAGAFMLGFHLQALIFQVGFAAGIT